MNKEDEIKKEIISWMNEKKVWEIKLISERQRIIAEFEELRRKHQDVVIERKLYRKAGKIVDGTGESDPRLKKERYDRDVKKFMKI